MASWLDREPPPAGAGGRQPGGLGRRLWEMGGRKVAGAADRGWREGKRATGAGCDGDDTMGRGRRRNEANGVDEEDEQCAFSGLEDDELNYLDVYGLPNCVG